MWCGNWTQLSLVHYGFQPWACQYPRTPLFYHFRVRNFKKTIEDLRLGLQTPASLLGRWWCNLSILNRTYASQEKNLTEASFKNDWHLTSGCRLQTVFLVQSWRPWWRPAAVTRVSNLGAGGLCTIQWKPMHVCLCQCRGLLDLRPFGRFNDRCFFMFLRDVRCRCWCAFIFVLRFGGGKWWWYKICNSSGFYL